MVRALWAAWLIPALAGAPAEYASAKRKIDLIERDALRPGSRVALTPGELNAYAARQAATAAPGAVRDTKLVLGHGSATGSALVNFLKLRQAQGESPGWLMSKLLDGERPVEVTAHIESGGGQARVKVQRVEVGGVSIEGRVLDFLIEHYLRPAYPEAKIDEPFQLGHRIERLEIRPAALDVVIGR